MIIEFYIATMIICGAPDNCTYYADKLGPVKSRAECQVRLDQLWKRVLVSESIELKYPEMGRNQFDHQGVCLDNLKKYDLGGWKEYWYER